MPNEAVGQIVDSQTIKMDKLIKIEATRLCLEEVGEICPELWQHFYFSLWYGRVILN